MAPNTETDRDGAVVPFECVWSVFGYTEKEYRLVGSGLDLSSAAMQLILIANRTARDRESYGR